MKNQDPVLIEVFTKLIPIYKDAIENIPSEDWRIYIREKEIHWGLCYASFKIFETLIFLQIAQELNGGYPNRIAPWPPNQSNSKEVVEITLRPRLEFMRNYLTQ
jgi:hypothetical protein